MQQNTAGHRCRQPARGQCLGHASLVVSGRRVWLLVMFATFSMIQPPHAAAQLSRLFGFGGEDVETISTDDVRALLAKQQQAAATAKAAGVDPPEKEYVVVDVRSDAEIKVSIIPGAITKAEYEKNRERYQGKTVIPYCTIGGRSGRYASQLKKDGIPVMNYKGSILEWVGAELPLVTLEGQPTNRVHTYSDHYQVPDKYQSVTK